MRCAAAFVSPQIGALWGRQVTRCARCQRRLPPSGECPIHGRPTGVVGVLHDACRRRGMPSASLWAAVPHYVAAVPNPKAALALLRRLEGFTGIVIEASELEDAMSRFDAVEGHRAQGRIYLGEYLLTEKDYAGALQDLDIYLCASPRMSASIRETLVRGGFPRRQLHEERFAF